MFDGRDGDGADQSDVEFFAQFASQRLFEGFAGFDLAAGEFPFVRGRVVATALADEDAAVGSFDDGGDDLNAQGTAPGDDVRIREEQGSGRAKIKCRAFT